MKRAVRRIWLHTLSFFPLFVLALAMAMAGIRTLSSPLFYGARSTLGALIVERLGGPIWDMFIEIGDVMDWLLALTPPLAGLIFYLKSLMGRTLLMSLYRHGGQARWLFRLQITMLLYTFLLTLAMAFATALTGFVVGMRGLYTFGKDASGFLNRVYWPVLFSMLTYALQSFMLLEVFLLCYLLIGDANLAILAFFLPVIVGLLRGSNEEMESSIGWYINWGIGARYSFSPHQYGVPLRYGLTRQLLLILGLGVLPYLPLSFRALTEKKEF